MVRIKYAEKRKQGGITVKKKLFGLIAILLLTPLSVQASLDVFDRTTTKANEISAALTGGLAAVVLTIVIIIAGMGMWFKWFDKKTAMMIIGGALLVGAAGSIANFLLG